MDSLLLTVCIAFTIIVLCLLLLGISKVFTGKSRLRIGMCGRVPTRERSEKAGCGSEHTCAICGQSEEKKED